MSEIRATPPNCIVCDRSFDTAANDPAFDRIPYEGTIFRAHGHYGSTIFDNFDGHSLEIVVCDKCILERLEGRVFMHSPFGGGVAQWDGKAETLRELTQPTPGDPQ